MMRQSQHTLSIGTHGKGLVEITRPVLAWVLAQPGVVAPIIGASKLAQLHDNLAALEVRLSPEQLQALQAGSMPEAPFPYGIFTSQISQSIFGGNTVRGGH